MNIPNDSLQPSLMQALKAATAAPHAELQELAYFKTLSEGHLPLESYVGHLRAMAVLHGVLEHAFSDSANPYVVEVWRDELRKLPLLLQDLRFFEPRAVADIREAVEAALNIAEGITLRSAQAPATLLGYLYVLEGSMLGAVTLAPEVARAFMLSANNGLAYLHGDGNEGAARWTQFKQRMNALELGTQQRAGIVQTAGDFFLGLKSLFAVLYPFRPESAVYSATTLNPEAGRHPIPSDSREIEAALRAADLCWARYPYYEFRYGERGRRFAHSDGAWLVTLCRFDQARVDQQIKWLARVLANRGMPSIMLQAKLELLFEQLSAAVPENPAQYQKLAQAALELSKARAQHLEAAQVQMIADEFDQAVGPEWSEKYRHTGMLLAAPWLMRRQGSQIRTTICALG